MASLLDNHLLPVWAWIIIIVVAALVVVGTLAFATRCVVRRKRDADFVDIFGRKDVPERRVTVRRGRVVPSSRYLSLTGSRFGLNAFNADVEDATPRSDRRSKSPFEWWNHVRNRSVSQESHHSITTVENPSVVSLASKGPLRQLYQHPDMQCSSTTVGSVSIREEESHAVTPDIKPETDPESPTYKPFNFSRSLSRQGHYASNPRGINTLSRIEEASRHTSMISTTQSRAFSFASRRNTASTILSSAHFPAPPSWNQAHSNTSNQTDDSLYHSAPDTPPKSLEIPRPVVYSSSRSSLAEIETGSGTETAPSTRGSAGHFPQDQAPITASPGVQDRAQNYWVSMRSGARPSVSGQKGRVLRKKSRREEGY